MNIEARMAIISHLSDAQEIGSFIISVDNELKLKMKQEQDLHINFAKRLLIKFKDNINQEISEDELDEIWKDMCAKLT